MRIDGLETAAGGFGDVLRLFGKIPLGFIIQSAIWVAAVYGTYVSMQNKIELALKQSAENTAQITSTRAELMDARFDLKAVNTKLDILMTNYERDMNRYVRDAQDRR